MEETPVKTTIHCLTCGALSDVDVTCEAGAAPPNWHCPACGEKARVMEDDVFFALHRSKASKFNGSPNGGV